MNFYLEIHNRFEEPFGLKCTIEEDKVEFNHFINDVINEIENELGFTVNTKDIVFISKEYAYRKYPFMKEE